MSGLLAGIRVIELGRMVAAPWCGQLLADLGADVIKVEQTGGGDQIRSFGPWLTDADGNPTRESSYFTAFNRGKRSLTVDFAKAEGREIVLRLARGADVFIENYKAGDLARYGLDAASLRPRYPDLIYLSITGFGQTGPYASRPGLDSVFQCMGGLVSVTGEPDAPPTKIGLTVCDLVTGLYGVVACLAALRGREVGGKSGQAIDLALLDSAIALMSHRAQDYLLTGDIPRPAGTGTPGTEPSGVFRCADGWINLQAATEKHFQTLCHVLGHEDWLAEPRFADVGQRWQHRDALRLAIETEFSRHPLPDLYELLVAGGVICSPIYTLDQAFADPQVRHRGVRETVQHPRAGEVPIVASPLRFSETPIEGYGPPPMLGEHTDAILGTLGYDVDTIARLRQYSVI
jgi:crotonobetainyl-CoA:carnitine CoA-transferase CaiB-like acyl-CoA transferase